MFVGKKLTDIRLLHGYSRNELAKLANVSEQSIWQYENNYNGPSLEVVNKFKEVFNVKTKYFFEENSYTTDFSSSVLAYRSKEINSVIKTRYETTHLEFVEGFINLLEGYIAYPKNKLVKIRNYCIRFMAEMNEQLDRTEIIQHIAEYARKELQLGNDNQRLMFALEKNGVFILEKCLGKDIDAYSAWSKKDKPILILGTAMKSSVRRNFDLAHELGHLLLHYKMDFSELTKSEYKLVEAEAHDFASYFLLPKKEFSEDIKQIQKVSNPDAYIDLKEKWMVSIVAMVYYARKLGYLTYEQYRYFYASLHRQNYTQLEPLDEKIKIIRPGKVRSSLQFLFEKEIISLEDLINTTNYNEKLIAKILGLPEEFFTNYLKEPTFFGVRYINERRDDSSRSS
ncbi:MULTISPECIES: ImmA/IrrE family metallo-endopeptidase [unclassified Sporosarcina]|uniref:spr1629 family repressor/antitoxin n=1 Tax=unclassified Sporosarcina TaxID=2647733 RepID=UPI00203CB574|nr:MULTISPECIES: XRE family transcriptional regulator [unclassified Sporosarcina]GKV66489.1 transcriptional regulator [Sporosarcina sp. NCCP-2331]GLB56766.1 transcriptional regulator [Sporosarcina sp. NCCP-2378]